MICPHCNREITIRLGLTEEQRILLDYIRAYGKKNKGRTPSYDEMRRAMVLKSKSGIHRMVKALEERGHIYRLPNRARSIAVVE